MARPLRIEFAGAVYHVFTRGNNRDRIYLDDADRRCFLKLLWQVCEQFDWRVWSYCLMGNHYHLLVETQLPTLVRGMRELNGNYSQKFNRRHNHVGHVFQGRYRAILVAKGGYVLEAARYIVLNPVRSDLCKAPEDWPWSSYRAMLRKATIPSRLAVDAALSAFGGSTEEARRAFHRFVLAGIGLPSPAAGTRVPSVFGDDAFVAEVGQRAVEPSPEVPKFERTWKSLAQIEQDAPTRDAAVRTAFASGVYSRAAIARYFGLSYWIARRIIMETGVSKTKKQDLTP